MKYPALIKAIGSASSQLQSRAVVAVNQALVLRNWLVGSWIIEYEQNGKDRAKYGARLLPTLAADLAAKEVKGLGSRTLRDCATFYSLYPGIRQSAVAVFGEPGTNLILQPSVAKLTHGQRLGNPQSQELPALLRHLSTDSADTVCRICRSNAGNHSEVLDHEFGRQRLPDSGRSVTGISHIAPS